MKINTRLLRRQLSELQEQYDYWGKHVSELRPGEYAMTRSALKLQIEELEARVEALEAEL
jgi:hypothetical protein